MKEVNTVNFSSGSLFQESLGLPTEIKRLPFHLSTPSRDLASAFIISKKKKKAGNDLKVEPRI